MSASGPILILEDDLEDQEFLRDAIKELGVLNELVFFTNGVAAMEYLMALKDQPFIILSDINLPLMDGFQFREKIFQDELLRKKSIPFVYFTTSGERKGVDKAYEMTVQGYFVKENTFPAIKESLKLILDYWSKCKHPNSV